MHDDVKTQEISTKSEGDTPETKNDSRDSKAIPMGNKDERMANSNESKQGESSNRIAKLTAGILLLDAPFLASLKSSGSEVSQRREASESPEMSNWMKKRSFKLIESLKSFFHEKDGKGIYVAWFYRPPSVSVKVCAISSSSQNIVRLTIDR
jgi:hypothetical protein